MQHLEIVIICTYYKNFIKIAQQVFFLLKYFLLFYSIIVFYFSIKLFFSYLYLKLDNFFVFINFPCIYLIFLLN